MCVVMYSVQLLKMYILIVRHLWICEKNLFLKNAVTVNTNTYASVELNARVMRSTEVFTEPTLLVR